MKHLFDQWKYRRRIESSDVGLLKFGSREFEITAIDGFTLIPYEIYWDGEQAVIFASEKQYYIYYNNSENWLYDEGS